MREAWRWNPQSTISNVLVKLVFRLIKICWHTNQELIKNGSDTIPIDRLAVLLFHYNLRGKIGWTTDILVGLVEIFNQFLRETEISELDIPVLIENDIFWLQVSVKDVQFMETFESQNYLAYVDPSLIFTETLIWLFLDDFSHVSTWAILQNQEEVSLGLE